jgi:hypothetical protein
MCLYTSKDVYVHADASSIHSEPDFLQCLVSEAHVYSTSKMDGSIPDTN